jgi:hypothetical protein
MLDRLDTDGAFSQRSASGTLCDIGRYCFYPDGLGHIDADKIHTCIGRRRAKHDFRVLAVE